MACVHCGGDHSSVTCPTTPHLEVQDKLLTSPTMMSAMIVHPDGSIEPVIPWSKILEQFIIITAQLQRAVNLLEHIDKHTTNIDRKEAKQ